VVFLIASLMTNDVALWAVWSRLGDEEFYMVVAVVLYYLPASASTRPYASKAVLLACYSLVRLT
jgi:hypothetical protein